ncbi:MAG: dTDP-4-dehydrorhamnose reductase [Thermoleophilaceae bacterium]|nr:dTDP-4-dehydrorhamnose reductase [Thermoleophilaceae bacterium]
MTTPLLVTGGSGYLGGELLRRAEGVGISSRELDIRDAPAVAALFERLRPQAVINAAYRRDDRATTFDGAVHVARAAVEVGARLVHVSTDVVFDGGKGTPYTEEDEPRPLTEYGRAKADAESAVLETHPSAVVVRTSLLYGGAQPGPQERLARDPSAAFFTDEVRCPIQVGDLADALVELVASKQSGILHVAGADQLSRHDFAELLAGRPVRAATTAESDSVRPRDCSLAIARARKLLGTRLRGAREVLETRRDP